MSHLPPPTILLHSCRHLQWATFPHPSFPPQPFFSMVIFWASHPLFPHRSHRPLSCIARSTGSSYMRLIFGWLGWFMVVWSSVTVVLPLIWSLGHPPLPHLTCSLVNIGHHGAPPLIVYHFLAGSWCLATRSGPLAPSRSYSCIPPLVVCGGFREAPPSHRSCYGGLPLMLPRLG